MRLARTALLTAACLGASSGFGFGVAPFPGRLVCVPALRTQVAGAQSHSVLRLSGGVGALSMSSTVESRDGVRARTEEMKAAAVNQVPFNEAELDDAVTSLRMLAGDDAAIDWAALRTLISKVGHVSHKDWAKTEEAAEELLGIIKGPDDEQFQRIMSRVLVDGNWPAAAAAAEARPETAKPWVVLVTGLNGIRKTSSVYQEWFKEVLHQALGQTYSGPVEELPDGSNSFFRQLDYMMATLANTEFARLYRVEDMGDYAALKDGIFQRYRKLAESLGVLMVKEAMKKQLNVMVETSGRDVAMFKYVDQFFPDDKYNKLVVHFTINELAFAESSVDRRMAKEMADGRAAEKTGDAMAMIRANAGGPYGSAVLKGVQADSDKVWESVSSGSAGVGKSWYKARINIHAAHDEWTASASNAPAGASAYTFGPPPR